MRQVSPTAGGMKMPLGEFFREESGIWGLKVFVIGKKLVNLQAITKMRRATNATKRFFSKKNSKK